MGGISTTTAGYKTESEYADSSVVRSGAEGHPPTRHDVTRRWSQGGLGRSGLLQQGIDTYQCRMPPGSIFHVSHVSALSVSDKTVPPKRRPWFFENERNFLRETRGGGIDPWPNLNSTSIERRKTNLRRNNSRQQQNKQHQTSRGSQNVAPKTQPRPSRPHPKLLLRLHANRPPRRRPRRSNHNRHTKHIHPLRRRPPTPLLRIRHLHHPTIHLPSPQALPLLLLLAPCAPATIQTPTANVPNPHAHPGTEAGAGVSSPRRRGAREARGRAGVLL